MHRSPLCPTSHPVSLPNATNKINTLTSGFGLDNARSFCCLPSSLSEKQRISRHEDSMAPLNR